MKRVVVLFLAVLLSACTTSRGFDRGRLERVLGAGQAPVTDEEIARVLKLSPQIPVPFRLGVYVKAGQWNRGLDLRWLAGGGDAGWEADLKRAGVVSDVVVVSPLTVAEEKLKEIRLGAARHGADAVLVVDSAYDVDRYNLENSDAVGEAAERAVASFKQELARRLKNLKGG